MKKEKITFLSIALMELVATVLSLTVFSGIYSWLAVIVVTVELLAAIALFIHVDNFENQVELLLLPLFISPIVNTFYRSWVVMLIVPILVIILLAVIGIVRKVGIDSEQGATDEFDKSELYSDKSVMIVVPHQDDDVNIAGGIIEEYIKYKSDVKICFYTNGDFELSAETRLRESLKVADFYGIPQDNIIFMGYGDRWNSEDGHICNVKDGKTVASASGKTSTYALTDHPAYHDGKLYCRENIVSDMKDIIEEFKPTDIFCVDYDCHGDHIACSIFFEEALLEVLKSSDRYHPNVYKGYAYETAFYSNRDYFRLNILSTVNGRRTTFMKKFVNFNWHDRVRFPVSQKAAARFIENNSVYKALSIYKSQDAADYAESIINGDKVFWLRRTDSLLYNAKITAGSGNVGVLNDFKIWDTNTVNDFPMSIIKGESVPDSNTLPQDGIWIPDVDDEEKMINVEFGEKKNIKEIYFYDNPSRSSNIINAEIKFDNGKTIETGPLNSDGSATVVKTDCKDVTSFTVKITDWDGDYPGLSEIEAFADDGNLPKFIKITDDRENFAYDYILENGEKALLSVYAYGLPKFSEKKYTININNEVCSAQISGDMIKILCPLGETCTLTVTHESGIYDSIKISNPRNKKMLDKAIKYDEYFYRVLRLHMQKKYYKTLALYFYDEFIYALRKFKK